MGDCAELRFEIAAFYQGFGQPAKLSEAMGAAMLMMPVTGDDRVLTSHYRGLDWICVFTGDEEFARYRDGRGETGSAWFRVLSGRTIIDEIASALPRPTGVVVNISGVMPMAFPPEIDRVER